MATTAADCLKVDDSAGRDELPDAKATAGEKTIGNEGCKADVGQRFVEDEVEDGSP